jgi:hypothetical protein
MYSFITQKSFVPYHDAVANGVHIVTAKIQRKVDSGARRSRTEENMVRARSEVAQDLAKEPSERRRGVVDFKEGYETLNLEEVEEVLADHKKVAISDYIDYLLGDDDDFSDEEDGGDLKEEDVKRKKEESENDDNGAIQRNAYESNRNERAFGADDSEADGVTRE